MVLFFKFVSVHSDLNAAPPESFGLRDMEVTNWKLPGRNYCRQLKDRVSEVKPC